MASGVLLAACASPTATLPFVPAGGEIEVPVDAVPGSTVTTAIRVERDVWTAAAPGHYFVEQSRTCFCGDNAAALVLEIRGEQVVRAWNRETGRPIVPGATMLSIQALFDHAIAAAESGRDIRVSYERSTRYPVLVYSEIPGTADSHLTYVTHLLGAGDSP